MAVKTPPAPDELVGKLGKLSGLLAPAKFTSAKPSGAPMELALDLIDPDPNQPRRDGNPGYSRESLGELAESIKARGVKSPISVRENPAAPGRYFINHGERRYRASRLAGLPTIRAFIDNDFEDADQVVENLQRADLTPREIADYIGRKLAAGMKRIEIAKLLGKSPSFITQHITLLDLPDPLADAFNDGRLGDVTVAFELATAYKKHPEEVAAWVSSPTTEITRRTSKAFRDFLESEDSGEAVAAPAPVPEQAVSAPAAEPKPSVKPAAKPSDKLRAPALHVEIDGREALLVLNKRPSAKGRAWVVFSDDGQEVDADLSHVTLRYVDEA